MRIECTAARYEIKEIRCILINRSTAALLQTLPTTTVNLALASNPF